MKKLIIAADNNKVLTLVALILGVLVGIFGSATGGLAVISGIITGVALLALEAMRRSYNLIWDHYRGKRWGLRFGMAIAFSAMFTGLANIVIGSNLMENLGIFLCISTILITISTAWSFLQLAREEFSLSDRKINLVIWAVLTGTVGLMATGCYALICWMMGVSLTDLLHDNVIVYGGCASLFLVAIFVVALIISIIASLWDKLVKWAQR